MKSTRLKLQALKLAGLSASILLFAVACGETGSEGNLRFADQTGADDKLVLPVAEGREASYKVSGSGAFDASRDIESAVSSDETVIQVVSQSGSTLTVRGLKPGTASVEVLATNGARDRLQLEVREEHTSYYQIKNLASDGGSVLGLVDTSGKYNLHTGDTARFHNPVFVDKDGIRLSGAGVVGLGEPDLGTGTMKGLFAEGDAALTVIAGDDGDTATLSNNYGSQMSFRTKDALEPVKIEGVRYAFPFVKNIQVGTAFRLPQGVFAVRFLPVDADGYQYVGSHNLGATAELSDAANVTVSYVNVGSDADEHCTSKDASDACVKWESLPTAAFTVTRPNDDAAASATIKITIGTQSQDFTLTLPAK